MPYLVGNIVEVYVVRLSILDIVLGVSWVWILNIVESDGRSCYSFVPILIGLLCCNCFAFRYWKWTQKMKLKKMVLILILIHKGRGSVLCLRLLLDRWNGWLVSYCWQWILFLFKFQHLLLLFQISRQLVLLWLFLSCAFCEKNYWYTFCNVELNNAFFWWQTIFLPVVGLVDPDKLKPGDLVGVNKDSYLILDTLPSEYDSRVKAMEVDEKPTEDYNDIGGLEKQVSIDYCLNLWNSIFFLVLGNATSESFNKLVFLHRFKN